MRLSGVTVVLGSVVALDTVDLELSGGEVAAIVGANGSGKSTLLGVLGGLVRPRSGVVHRPPGRPALVSQESEGYRRLPITVRQTVTMGRWAERGRLGRIRASDRAIVQGALERCGLDQLADRRLGELSGGQRQRVLVARALAQQSGVILLDEPTAAADSASTDLIHRLLRAAADAGCLVVISSHDPAVHGIADRTVVLDYGRVTTETPRKCGTARPAGAVPPINTEPPTAAVPTIGPEAPSDARLTHAAGTHEEFGPNTDAGATEPGPPEAPTVSRPAAAPR
ncbi:ATP-binding cassette domain-containing protein [Nakamurella sp. YIM 132087]|uniref:ATP-binding cassette domain-containing protein n=1 Tax=Nakamurella alba TaxID=2665158 RepID=A0A7K1FPY7_9ACTN|nr:ATP-binding cassette domain-containing protein [Nakamurella alba]